MREIEVDAIMRSNAHENAARAADGLPAIVINRTDVEAVFNEAMNQLRAAGVPAPTKIPGAR